jgi:hypothetical protein
VEQWRLTGWVRGGTRRVVVYVDAASARDAYVEPMKRYPATQFAFAMTVLTTVPPEFKGGLLSVDDATAFDPEATGKAGRGG